MVDQFEAKKCLHAASTDNLVLTIIDSRSDSKAAPRQTLGQPSGNSNGTYPRTRTESRSNTPGVAQRDIGFKMMYDMFVFYDFEIFSNFQKRFKFRILRENCS